MGSVLNTAQLIEAKKAVLLHEAKNEAIMTTFGKKHRIDFERPNDYGERGFVLDIRFDEFNIEALKRIDDLKEAFLAFIQARKQQKLLEVDYDIDQRIKKDMTRSMRFGT